MTEGLAGWTRPSAARIAELIAAPPPRTPTAELDARRALLVAAAAEHDVDLVLVYGADRSGTGVPWLTSWQVTREAALLVDARDGGDVLWLQFHNHVPLAREVAHGCEVRWGGPSTQDAVVAEVTARDAAGRRIGVMGPVGFRLHAALAGACAAVVDLSGAATRLRLVKSPFELELLAAGAHLSDRAALALRDGIHVGMVDHELADLVERAYVPLGGTTHIHYFGLSSMSRSDRGVPSQTTVGRVLGPDDVLVTELSAALEGNPGQVLRTMTTADALGPLHAELHAVADAAFAAVTRALVPGASCAEVVAASSLIEEAGYTIIDDLVHGFGGGYLPPVLGTASRPAGPLPDLTIRAGMTVVVQPNVATLDGRAGVQTGELVVVTDEGAVSLHDVPPGPWIGVGRGSTGASATTASGAAR